MRPAPSRAPLVRALAASFALALAACSGGGDEPYVLGLAAPLTDGAGKADMYGVRSQRGAELAVEEINAAGGIDGRPLRLKQVDDHGSQETALKVAGELADDPAVLAVVGHVYSGATMKAAERYQGAPGLPPIAAVATSATSPAISRAGEWIFRVASSDSANAVALAGEAVRMGRRVAVAYANDEYGRGLVMPFLAALQANRVAPVESDPFLADTEDFRPYLRRMQARGVDLLFVAGLQDAAARVIDQAKEVGLAARVLGGDGVEGLVSMGPAYEGTVVGVLYHELASDSSRVFAARYRARYKEEPDSQAALAFDAVRLLARALREGHRDRESIRRYLEGVGRQGGSEPFPGAAGTVSFDANGDPMNKKLNVGEIRGGRIVPLRAAR